MNRFIGLIFFCALTVVSCNSADEPVKEVQVEPVEEVTPQVARLDSLSQLLEKSPSNTDLLNERAKAFLDVNEVNYALTDIGKALLLDSTVAKYYLTISDVYFRLNKSAQCKNALLKAHEIQPDYVEPLHRLSQFELYLGNHQASINYANDMLRIDARDDRPFMVKALCFKELGDTAKAINNYLEATTENPDNYDAFVELGVLHWARNNPLAESYLKSALDIRPDGVQIIFSFHFIKVRKRKK